MGRSKQGIRNSPLVLKVGSRGFFVNTNDIEHLMDVLGGECRPEVISEGHYYFEFIMPFRTSNEASIRLKKVLNEEEYNFVTKGIA